MAGIRLTPTDSVPFCDVDPRVNPRQLEVLQWIADGCPDGRWPPDDVSFKLSSVALQNRKLVTIRGRGPRWTATITDAGRHYLEHGAYPDDHPLALKPAAPTASTLAAEDAPALPIPSEDEQEASGPARRQRRRRSSPPSQADERFAIDSPRRMRARGAGAARDSPEHPWDDRVLISVKEAAWVLSLSEGLIRTATRDGDIDRVYIGAGTTNYRIVYNSLLAWVNSMPQEPVRSRW